jgi:hypothetical protein
MNRRSTGHGSTKDAKNYKVKEKTKLKWLQDPSEINGDNLNNKRRETSGNFRKKVGIPERKN